MDTDRWKNKWTKREEEEREKDREKNERGGGRTEVRCGRRKLARKKPSNYGLLISSFNFRLGWHGILSLIYLKINL